MTAGSLAGVATWDVPRVRGEVARLAAVADRLPRWRFRVEAVGRSLETAQCWSGRAARSAAAAVVELSGATASVAAGLDRSLTAFQRMAVEAATARELAGQSLALLAAGLPTDWMAGAVAGRTSAAAEHAAATTDAARSAGEALAGLGVVDAFAPADFADLPAWPGPAAVPGAPAAGEPGLVARWWAALPEGARDAVIAAEPGEIGGLDGVPGWARDRANRLLLEQTLDRPGEPRAVAAAVAAWLAEATAAGRPVQLYTFDPGAGLVALAFGDVDTADALSVVVPGIRTTVLDDLPGLARQAEDLASAARAAAPGLAVATIAWLGYRTPQRPAEIVTRGDARRGGRELDDTLAGLAAARAAAGGLRPRTTVVAHSYGTVVVDQAADLPGRLPADAVVLLGSPGMDGDGPLCGEVPEVYDAAAPLDPVSWVGWFGVDTWDERYPAVELPADWNTQHADYFDRGRPTLPAMGEVVAGTRDRG